MIRGRLGSRKMTLINRFCEGGRPVLDLSELLGEVLQLRLGQSSDESSYLGFFFFKKKESSYLTK